MGEWYGVATNSDGRVTLQGPVHGRDSPPLFERNDLDPMLCPDGRCPEL